MNRQEIIKLLREDLEYKKYYEDAFHSQCDGCGDYLEGGDFVFMGDKKKICTECLASITDLLERL